MGIEQVINGGFEEALTVGWNATNPAALNCTNPWTRVANGCGGSSWQVKGDYPRECIAQDFEPAISVDSIESWTILYTMAANSPQWRMYVYFTDGTSDFFGGGCCDSIGTCQECDITACPAGSGNNLSDYSGKYIEKIVLYVNWTDTGNVKVDDVSIIASLSEEGTVDLISVCGDNPSVSLDNVLTWREEEGVPIPIKRIPRKASPTTQAEYYYMSPRTINLEFRVTRSKKEDIEEIKHLHCWNELYDYNNDFVDYVWIESLNFRWAGDEDHNYPWFGRVALICSNV